MEIHRLSLVLHLVLFFITVSTNTICRIDDCYDLQGKPRPCMASPVNMAFRRNISATNTCGKPKGGFCELGSGKNCYECDANNSSWRHPASFMVDKEFHSSYNPDKITWWQSQTWWETNNLGLSSKSSSPKVNITLSFGRSFHISGGILVRFYNRRPKALFFEKSKDFGKTWRVLQYFASDCSRFFHMPAAVGVPKRDRFAVTCTEDYSSMYPQKYGKVEFRFDSRYDPGCGFFQQSVQDFLLATNVRVRLQYPPTDGMEVLFDQEDILNKYYYTIADIVITGRCNCHGHAKYCTGPHMEETCECEHNTMGTDCEKCKPLFNKRPWMPANATHANECQECQCYNHASSCVYNDILEQSECVNCQHNTQGQYCEKCLPMYYRDSSVHMTDTNTCVPCTCFQEGIINDGLCLQEATPSEEAGQCLCKNNVLGRQCGQCAPGYWGLRLHPPGKCQECGCYTMGTIGNTIECNQHTGKCPCKRTVQGSYCTECKDGYYFFPVQSDDECVGCPCDLGGAFHGCDKHSGTCSCRHGVEGIHCKRSQAGHFFPALDYVRFEAESMTGSFSTALHPWLVSEGVFTRRGYATLLPGQYVLFHNISSPASYWFHPVVRYGLPESCSFGFAAKLVLRTESNKFNNSVQFEKFIDRLSLGLGQAWMIPETVQLLVSELYNFTLFYTNSDHANNCSLIVDSLVLFPNLNSTRVYTQSSANTRRRLTECFKSSVSQDNKPKAAYCEPLVFSASSEIYNGTLACGCDPTGSLPDSECSLYGGQCSCRPGVVGRTCGHCANSFYGFPTSGCTPCGCSVTGSVQTSCDITSGECSCKDNVGGRKCDSCTPGTFNLNSANPHGCLQCFGYGRATSCTSAAGFVPSLIASQFVNQSDSNWTVVDSGDNPVPLAYSSRYSTGGMVVTSPPSPSVVFIAAPFWFLGPQFWSYGQQLHVTMNIRDLGMGQNPTGTGGDVILKSGEKEVALNFIPSPSPNITSYHLVLDETHAVVGQSVSAFEFQAILANLTSLKVRATYYPFPNGSVTFQDISLETAIREPGSPEEEWVGFVENATCQVNYTGLSCQRCASGFTRELAGGGSFDRCVLCACNNRSTECDEETGACRNCKLGTNGDRCQLCNSNVQEPECRSCKPGYWGLTPNGCTACDCHLPGTEHGNNTLCDQITGQCVCNATLNIGGRRCDMCKENSWNASAGRFGCEECPPCFGSVQEEEVMVHTLISKLQEQLTARKDHRIMFHDQTFFERLRYLNLSVNNLSETTTSALELESKSSSRWQRFSVAVNDLGTKLDISTATDVNQTLHYTSAVENNLRKAKDCLPQIRDVMTAASHLLKTPVRLGLEHAESLSSSLGYIALQMADFIDVAIRRENQTLREKDTVQAGVEHALSIASNAAEGAHSISSQQAQLGSVLEALYVNSSEINIAGKQTAGMVTDMFLNAGRAYNESAKTIAEAMKPKPDTSNVLQQLITASSDSMTEAIQYFNQFDVLNKSCELVQVIAAIERSAVLGLEVQTDLNNGTEVLAGCRATHSAAQAAVSRAKHVKETAQVMRDVMNNFEDKSQQAQALSTAALLKIGSIQNISQSIIMNVSAVNDSLTKSLLVAREAMRLGVVVKHLLITERQVVDKTNDIASHLMNETAAEENLIGKNAAGDLIAGDIKPVQRMCQNLSGLASNTSNSSHALLARVSQVNDTTQRLISLIKRVVNERIYQPGSSSGNKLPTLERELRIIRQKFGGLQLGGKLAELRGELRLQRQLVMRYRERIRLLWSDITVRRNLLHSLASVAPC